IFALPGTITGSIGVFSLRVVTEGLYNKLGARRQVVKRGEHADAYRDLRESSAEEDTLMQGLIDDFYRSFLSKVAAGRSMSVDAVDSIGQGRVWIGSDAQRVGIVDELGGFLDALEYAKQAAKLRDCDLVFYPKPKPGLGADFLDFAVEQARKAIE
ncbi:S49 family peptidase, partial [candidate division WOR-3 bacterium]|nr:S49 family peptidase [candidate division WOR-3 bacterium]